jgi:hypothetical protein
MQQIAVEEKDKIIDSLWEHIKHREMGNKGFVNVSNTFTLDTTELVDGFMNELGLNDKKGKKAMVYEGLIRAGLDALGYPLNNLSKN